MKTVSYPLLARQFMEAQVQAGNTDANTATQINTLKYVESKHFVRADVSSFGSGTANIIDGTVNKVVGVCSIHQGKLNSLENLILSGLVIGWANPADTATPGVVNYSTVETNIDPAIGNGTIIIEQEGRKVLELPINKHMHSAASDKTVAQQGWEYDQFRYIKAETPFEVRLELGSAVNPGVGKKTFLYVGFQGWITQK